VLPLLDNDTQILTIVIYNHAAGNAPITPCDVQVDVTGLVNPQISGESGMSSKIDALHTNPKGRWIELGMPQYPTQKQIDDLMEHSKIISEKLIFSTTPSVLSFTTTISPRAVVVVTVSNKVLTH